MNDKTRQEQLLEMIEQLIASETVESTGATEAETDELLALARELNEARPEPSEPFKRVLESRLAKLRAQTAANQTAANQTAANGAFREKCLSGKGHWLPVWLTAPRIAAVAAVLVMGLAVAGLAGALIHGGYNSSGTAMQAAAFNDQTRSTDAQTMEKATGVAPVESDVQARGENAGSLGSVAGTPGGNGIGTQSLPSGQKIMLSADFQIDIQPGEFNDKYAQVTAIAAKYGGYVASADASSPSNHDLLQRGSISIRVLNTNDNFNQAQTEIDALGKVTGKKVSSQDVTEDYVDLQSRLRNAEAQETQLLALMQKAQTVEEILSVQLRLSDVQAQIEQIKGRMKYMDTRTDFASITVNLRETENGGDAQNNGIDWGFASSLKYAGWLAVQTVNFVIEALGIIAPLLLLAIGFYFLAYRLLRWRRER